MLHLMANLLHVLEKRFCKHVENTTIKTRGKLSLVWKCIQTYGLAGIDQRGACRALRNAVEIGKIASIYLEVILPTKCENILKFQ